MGPLEAGWHTGHGVSLGSDSGGRLSGKELESVFMWRCLQGAGEA